MNIAPERLEALALAGLTAAEDIRAAAAAGLTAEAFQVPAAREAWARTIAKVTTGKRPLSLKDMEALGAEPEAGALDVEAYVAELVKRDMSRRGRQVLARYIPSLDDNPESALKAIVLELGELRRGHNPHVGFLDDGGGRRLAAVKERVDARAAGTVVGIPTGLPVFDNDADTWQPGEIITILGIPTSGKSSLLVYFCSVAFRAGRRVLFLSPENSLRDIEWRADVVLADLDDEEWHNTLGDLRKGRADMEEYGRWLAKLGNRERWVTVDSGERGAFSVDDVISLTREHKPDILAIDGFHLLTGRGRSWEVMFEAAKRIKGLTQGLGITTLCVTQATREAAVVQEDTPELHQSAYGNAIMEDTNRLITMARVRGNKLRRVFKTPKFRDGVEVTYRQYLEFDIDHGHIRQLEAKDAGGGHVEF